MDQEIKQRIETLKKEKDAVILAHYYVDGEVQEIADYVGDSYYLAELATTVPQKTIIFCGVSFMGESAKILSPEKTVSWQTGARTVRWRTWLRWRRSTKYAKSIRM